jgi:hypothetical protein
VVCVDATTILVPQLHVATRGFTVVVLGSILELRNVIVSIWKLTSHIEPGILKIGVTRGVTNKIAIYAEDIEGNVPGVALGNIRLLLVEGENACLGVELLQCSLRRVSGIVVEDSIGRLTVKDGGAVPCNVRREWSSGSKGEEAQQREEAEDYLGKEECILNVRKWSR